MTTKAKEFPVADLIDLDRYPMADLTTPTGQAFTAECRERLRENGVCSLPGFLKPSTAAAMAKHGLSLLSRSYRDESRHNVYFTTEDTTLPTGHPGYPSQRLAANTIPYDLIDDDQPLRHLYNWEPLRAFIAAVLGKEELYLHADPMGAMILFVYGEGDELGWHFDHADFVTTLLLQAPERGGAFEHVKDLRSAENENHDGIRKVLTGASDRIENVSGTAGTLSLFVGQNSIHRVTRIGGDRARVVAVLSYEEEPGVIFTEEEQLRFYGRTCKRA